MPESREARSIIDKAEQAAAAGNYACAEELLREAATFQEQTLGPHHPDLINTLNNLGVVCEMADNPIDAEHYFRRAYAIAAATLPANHPFVATSGRNLHDFCAARGRPVELPRSSPAIAAWLEAPAPEAVPPRESSRSAKLALGALGVGVLLSVILMMARFGGSRTEHPAAPPAAAIATAGETQAPPPAVPPVEPLARRQTTAKLTQPARRDTDAVIATPTTPPRSAAMPVVVTARLCTALKAWRCEAADSQVSPGAMFFYTQVKSATATTLEHRWYQGDRLRQAVKLRIRSNPGAGYRTYSRNTISSERVGDWRVELRSADGVVLHEERFTVR